MFGDGERWTLFFFFGLLAGGGDGDYDKHEHEEEEENEREGERAHIFFLFSTLSISSPPNALATGVEDPLLLSPYLKLMMLGLSFCHLEFLGFEKEDF